jgi:hypothetical protein
MKKIIIIVTCFLTTSLLHAQVCGYQGRRTVVEIHGMTSPLALLLGVFGESRSLPFTTKIHVEYALKRKLSLALEGRSYSFKADGTSRKSAVLMLCNFTRDWALAPYGRFFNVGVGYNIESAQGSSTALEAKDAYYSLHFVTGQRNIVAKRIAISYGLEAWTPLNGNAFGDDALNTLFNFTLGVGYLF